MKEKLKLVKRKALQKGSSNVYIIFIIGLVVFSALLINGITPTSQDDASPTPGQKMVIDPSSLDQKSNNKDALQLKTFKFLTPTEAPKNNDCNDGVNISSSEPRILWAIAPDPGGSVGAGGKLIAWYNDEWPLSLGDSSSIQTTYNGHIVDPDVGNLSAKDSNGFPLFPAVFITDITSNPNDKSGDAENGGTPHKPDEIWGAWKQSGAPNDMSSYGQGNNLQLPSGADPFPANSNVKFGDSGMMERPRETINGTEIIWKVDNLHLTTGHSYRAQFILHDGDQSLGGDIGEACTSIKL